MNFVELLDAPEVFYEYGVFKQVYCCKRFITIDCNWALRWASLHGHLNMVEHLIKGGSDVNDVDDDAVRWASGNGHLKTVKYLIENGADATTLNNMAVTWAFENDHHYIVDYLILMGCHLDMTKYGFDDSTHKK